MALGFFGKLPSRADFVGKGLPESFLTPFDTWLRAVLAAARADLGGDWAEIFLNSPVWRFTLTAGLAGPDAVAGVLVPSVDRSGREFPFLVALCSPVALQPAALAAAAAGWLDRAGQAAVAAVRRGLDPAGMAPLMAALAMPPLPAATRMSATAGGWRVEEAGRLGAALPQLLDRMAAVERASLWWSDGSDRVRPTTLMIDGLPPPARFGAFIDGEWARRGW